MEPEINVAKADVLVIGGGVAGLMAVLRAREFCHKVILVDKAKVARSGCSPFAAGIYDAFFPEDDLEAWMKEFIRAGEFLNHQEWVKQHLLTTPRVVGLLAEWARARNIQIFERDEKGKLLRKKSRAHVETSHLVFNALAAVDTLRRRAQQCKIAFRERTMVTDLVIDERGRAVGALGFEYRRGKFYLLLASALVIAAGGCGYKSIFLGHKNLTGDLQAAAWQAGAVFKNMEFTSSNTCHKDYDIHGLNLFVHVGGRFLNAQGEDFMWKYRPDLGPRARRQDLCLAFCQEVKEGRGPIYLDMTRASEEGKKLCRKILPQTFMAFERAGIDPFGQPLEWVPAFYGTISTSGGLEIDLEGKTSLPGLFAAGDAASAPANGTGGPGGSAYAFASTSGYLAGEAAGKEANATGPAINEGRYTREAKGLAGLFIRPLLRSKGLSSAQVCHELQELIFPFPISYLKSKASLEQALQRLPEIKGLAQEIKAADSHELVSAREVQNMVTLAELFLKASLLRTESRGFHFREDYPRTDNLNWLKWLCLKKENGQPEFWTQEIPTPFLKPAKDYDIPPGIRREGRSFPD